MLNGAEQYWRSEMTLRAMGRAFCMILIILVARPGAWAGQEQVATALNSSLVTSTSADSSHINLLVGRSAVLNVGSAISRVSLTTPDVADAMVTAPQQLLIHGKAPGTISLFVWDSRGAIRTYEVVVRRDLSALAERLIQLFPGERISVAASGSDVVVAGTVSSKYVVEKAAEVAAGYVESKDHVVNLLRQQEGVASNQILLRVRFAEVSRSAVQELGASFFTGATGHKDYVGRVTTQQFPAPDFDNDEGLVFSDFLNLFVFNLRENIGGVIKALQTRGLFQSLAEPNLIAQNGTEASFLAGGEFPYPVVQGTGGANTAITIQFKEFGVRLNFTPTVLAGDLIHLKVRPEVSALDFSNGISIQGFRIPALSTRRTETEVELRNGQTFAIAGLLNNTLTSTMQKLPGLGDIPILGLLFRSRAYQKAETELVVMITPQILRRDATGAASELPTLVDPYLGPPHRRLPPPPPYVGAPKYPAAPPPGGAAAAMPDPAQPEPAQLEAVTPSLGHPAAVEPSPGNPGPAGTATAPNTPAAPEAPSALTSVEKALKWAEEARQETEEKRRENEEEEDERNGVLEAKQAAEAEKEARRTAEEERRRQEELAREEARQEAERKQREAKLAREEAKQEAEQKKREAKLAREEAKREAERKKREAKLAREEAKREADRKKREEKLAREQAKREAEQKEREEKLAREKAKREAEEAKEMEEKARARREALAEAEAQLRAAQYEYQATLESLRKIDGERNNDDVNTIPPPK